MDYIIYCNNSLLFQIKFFFINNKMSFFDFMIKLDFSKRIFAVFAYVLCIICVLFTQDILNSIKYQDEAHK